LDIKEIKAIIDLMRKNDLSVFKMESEGFKLTLKKGGDYQPLITVPAQPMAGFPTQFPAAPSTPAAPEHEPAGTFKEIVSPMVGTFYRSPSPETAPLIEVGTQITPDGVACIIEAMKVMNEIKAEIGGTVTEILVENGKPVQFGQPLFRVR